MTREEVAGQPCCPGALLCNAETCTILVASRQFTLPQEAEQLCAGCCFRAGSGGGQPITPVGADHSTKGLPSDKRSPTFVARDDPAASLTEAAAAAHSSSTAHLMPGSNIRLQRPLSLQLEDLPLTTWWCPAQRRPWGRPRRWPWRWSRRHEGRQQGGDRAAQACRRVHCPGQGGRSCHV